MQPLTAPPRSAFTVEQVTALLVATDLEVDFGCELLDASLALVEDISADVSGGTIHRSMAADVHGTCELTISRALAWGRDRVRPYMVLSSATAGVSGCRFNLGTYLLTTPDRPLGEDPPTYTVTGYDELHILQGCTGDTYGVQAGEPVLTMVREFVLAAGVLAPVLLDSTAEAKVLAVEMSWPITSSDSPSWLRIINDLLACVGYRGLWADQDGNLRSSPYVLPSQRPAEWVFDVGSLTTGIVAAKATVTNDTWNSPNWWRFIRNGLTVPPTEGAGMVTLANGSTGLSSYASVGRWVRAPVQFLDAVDQASLVTQGERIKANDMRCTEVIQATMSPMPIAGHADVAEWNDPVLGGSRKVLCRSWDLPLSGEDQTYVVETV